MSPHVFSSSSYFSEGCGKVSRRCFPKMMGNKPLWYLSCCENSQIIASHDQLSAFNFSTPVASGPGVVTTKTLPWETFLGLGGHFLTIFFVEHLPLPVCRFAHSSMHPEDTYNLLICKHIFIYTYCNMCNSMNQAKCLSERETVQYFQILQTKHEAY